MARVPSIPPPADSPVSEVPVASNGALVAVLERNRTVAGRIARVLKAATGVPLVAVEDDPATLRSQLSADPQLLACEASEIELAVDWASDRYPNLKIIAWTQDDVEALLPIVEANRSIVGVVGWPSFASMPRPWELLQLARKAMPSSDRRDAPAELPSLTDTIPWGGTVVKYVPRTSRERDLVVADVAVHAERLGATSRTAQRAGEVTHEFLMNAMYDAPVDSLGNSLFAHDRKQDVSLGRDHAPTLRVGGDGMTFAVQIRDPFGGLDRATLLRSIRRGRAASGGGQQVLDTSNGGAGLGLFRCYAAAQVLAVEVIPGHATQITAWFDLDIPPREARRVPTSLHLFLP